MRHPPREGWPSEEGQPTSRARLGKAKVRPQAEAELCPKIISLNFPSAGFARPRKQTKSRHVAMQGEMRANIAEAPWKSPGAISHPFTSASKIIIVSTARAVQCRVLLHSTGKHPANLGSAPTVRARDASWRRLSCATKLPNRRASLSRGGRQRGAGKSRCEA